MLHHLLRRVSETQEPKRVFPPFFLFLVFSQCATTPAHFLQASSHGLFQDQQGGEQNTAEPTNQQ